MHLKYIENRSQIIKKVNIFIFISILFFSFKCVYFYIFYGIVHHFPDPVNFLSVKFKFNLLFMILLYI